MKKILVANRGEIALRVMKSAREMGILTVAVYSEADRLSPHVRYADEAVCIGPAPSKESYLRGDKIIEVAKKLQVDGIHPGYGFLSENATFAAMVEQNGITFIGPTPESIEIMGSKLAAKEAAKKFNIPMVPGSEGAITNIQEAKTLARAIGYPVLIKASAGGGGKGMRVVYREEELEEQMTRAQSEALNAFGDGSVFIEKYVASPKHIEVQILGDNYGNIVYLYERECSVQRRHQKVIEEAPSSCLTPEKRRAIGEAAVLVGKSCAYIGAGTVEFLVDEQLNFYFLEMNTRLQVEHPVTEMITGIDLVKEQIKIARGEKLSFTQEEIPLRGHAIELRVYAEDPANNFLPDIGRLTEYRKPEGPGIRVDDGYEAGMHIPIYYDPLLAKLIAYGSDRSEAIARLLRAIDDYQITGVKNTLSFGKFVLQHPDFLNGTFDTHFVARHFRPELLCYEQEDEMEIAAHFAAFTYQQSQKQTSALTTQSAHRSNWVRNRSQYRH
ncbi:MAG: acetyl-CoA carboxylase biotin carboxylase subunit [Chitinophagales bacterium]|nr:acetyl-CoA carboxylase biotin carboxylase subunit [Chitinophagales bacterium]MDW8419103.1 acetyl-CoA carboxylase biotin carboxylase subunit [Chitinophagales bacterium]